MPSAKKLHGLRRQEEQRVQERFVARARDSQAKFATTNGHFLKHLIDRVLVFPRPVGDATPEVGSVLLQESRRCLSLAARALAEEPPEIAVVDARLLRLVAGALRLVVLAQRFFELVDGIHLTPRTDERLLAADFADLDDRHVAVREELPCLIALDEGLQDQPRR